MMLLRSDWRHQRSVLMRAKSKIRTKRRKIVLGLILKGLWGGVFFHTPHPTYCPVGHLLILINLDPCDVLMLYTDGITEAQNARGEFFIEVAQIDSHE